MLDEIFQNLDRFKQVFLLFYPLSPCKSLGILHSEDELATYEKLGVENHVRNIISELCNRSDGKGVSFESHTNSFEAGARDDPSQRPRPDWFRIQKSIRIAF